MAEQFEVECGEFNDAERLTFAELMKDIRIKGVWDKIVKQINLVPFKLAVC